MTSYSLIYIVHTVGVYDQPSFPVEDGKTQETQTSVTIPIWTASVFT